jgi:serine/threonine protein kinase
VPTDATAVLAGRYALEEVIGRGGMADVYRATDLVLDRAVAVKLLRNLTEDSSERARFTVEARTLARLNHPNLVTVLDAGTAEEQPYLVMELIDGPTLADCCRGTALDDARVTSLGAQLADALAYAHAAGVVHRDVKPGNVMLGGDGRAWLTDFGIARLVGDTARHTATGTTIGSPAYLSPEQVTGAEVTTSADVYSLGLVLLEALTGRPSYSGPPTEAALARLSSPPALPDSLTAGWHRLLQDMTTLEPTGRPSAQQVADRLRRLSTPPETATAGAAAAPAAGDTAVLPGPSLDEPPSSGTTHLLRQGARGARLRSVRPGWWVLAVTAVLVAVVVMVVAGGESPSEYAVPRDVPAELREPLRELHDAVHEEAG